MRFVIDTRDEFIPPVHPPGVDRPGRCRPNTHVMVRVEEWPGNVFRLWFPGHVMPDLWSNMTDRGMTQDFVRAEPNGLRWSFDGNPVAIIAAQLSSVGLPPHDCAHHRSFRRRSGGRGR